MQLTIEKLVFGGQGLAKKDGKTYLVWNALPGETVEVKITKKAQSVYEAEATDILQASPYRITPPESHYLSCSPWQMMQPEFENEWKQHIATETYQRLGGLKKPNLLEIVSDPKKILGYRNKIEYSFAKSDSGVSYAFFGRESHSKYPLSFCLLADDSINKSAAHILDWIKKEGFPAHVLKSLIIRSDSAGHTIAALFIHEALGIQSNPVLNELLTGFHIYHEKRLIHSAGEKTLTAFLGKQSFQFGLFSFFQIHKTLFEKTIEDMAIYTDPSRKLVDFYSGVGAIGISLLKNCKSAILVDSHEEAISYAKENIKLNKLENCEAFCAPAEKMTRAIDDESILVFDPPRAGLEDKIIQKILSKKPVRILYLSCNIATHARDIKKLSAAYRIKDLKLYNFFPRTPHIESLAVLDRF